MFLVLLIYELLLIGKQTFEEICKITIGENQETITTKEDFERLKSELFNRAINDYILNIVQGIHDKRNVRNNIC